MVVMIFFFLCLLQGAETCHNLSVDGRNAVISDIQNFPYVQRLKQN